MTDTTPNSDARPPGNAWVARCFERRDDVAPTLPGKSDLACLSAGNSSPVIDPAKDTDDRVLFVSSAAVSIQAPLLDAANNGAT